MSWLHATAIQTWCFALSRWNHAKKIGLWPESSWFLAQTGHQFSYGEHLVRGGRGHLVWGGREHLVRGGREHLVRGGREHLVRGVREHLVRGGREPFSPRRSRAFSPRRSRAFSPPITHLHPQENFYHVMELNTRSKSCIKSRVILHHLIKKTISDVISTERQSVFQRSQERQGRGVWVLPYMGNTGNTGMCRSTGCGFCLSESATGYTNHPFLSGTGVYLVGSGTGSKI